MRKGRRERRRVEQVVGQEEERADQEGQQWGQKALGLVIQQALYHRGSSITPKKGQGGPN